MKASIILEGLRKNRVQWLELIPENEEERKQLEKIFELQPVFVSCSMTGYRDRLEKLHFSGKQ